MMLGACAGGAVRLGPVARRLAIAEGIETALSIAQACTEVPVWAALSTSGMRALLLPSEVREVILCADGDQAGHDAAAAAGEKFRVEGRRVRISAPPDGADFNDVLREAC